MKNRTETIRKMVTYLNNEDKDGGFWLPNIQRAFVWHEDQIERLFDWFSGQSDHYLDMHLIPKQSELWALENYEQFIDARKQLILSKFSYMLQAEE